MIVVAHLTAGHWWEALAYLSPLLVFGVYFVVSTLLGRSRHESRRETEEGSGDRPGDGGMKR